MPRPKITMRPSHKHFSEMMTEGEKPKPVKVGGAPIKTGRLEPDEHLKNMKKQRFKEFQESEKKKQANRVA